MRRTARVFGLSLLLTALPLALFAQPAPTPPAAAAPIAPSDPAARLTVATVSSEVSITATLLPPNVTRGVFGRAVADRYAAVEVVVSNRSHDSALIVHSVFLDYSRWLFSGAERRQLPPCTKRDADSTAPATRATLPACENQPEPWEVATRGDQIAAAEYRIPRGTLLDSEVWSFRNWMIRIAETVGSIASGYVFTVKETNAAKSVAAYNGNFLPALRALLPDSAVDQANRLSDLGFRVNKVIPKESSDVLVAFFPIDRFLTPGVKKLYLESPAIFFVPQSVLFDVKARQLLLRAAGNLGIEQKDFDDLLRQVREDPDKASKSPLMQMLDRISLNNIRLIVGGSMNVDVNTVPASIESIAFDETDPTALWAETGVKKGTIRGRYLSNGKVTVVGAEALQITDGSTLEDGSTDSTLRFQFTLNMALASGTKLTFRVDKRSGDTTTEGIAFDYVVTYGLVTPTIEKIERTGNTLTITGQRFFNTETNPLTVTLQPGGVAGLEPKPVKDVARTPRELKIDLAPLSLSAACWTPQVSVGTMSALGATPFAQAPAPKIMSAKKNGTRIVVTGDQFIDLMMCGKPLAFEVAEQAAGSAFKAVSQPVIVSPREASFDFPREPANGKFKVRVLVGGVEADTRNVE